MRTDRRLDRRGAGQHAVPWSPVDDPDTILWLDPRSPSTFLLTGSNLDSWTDRKSGLVCTPTTVNKWTYDATIIGGDYPGFNVLGYPLSIPVGPLLNGASAITILCVCYDDNNSAAYLCEYGANGAANSGTFAILPNFSVADSISMFCPGSVGANQWRVTAGAIDLATPRVLTFRADYALSTDEVFPIRSNGADLAGAYVTNTNSAGTTFANQTLYLGARGTGANGWLGHVGDIIIVKRALTGADLAKFEAFLQ